LIAKAFDGKANRFLTLTVNPCTDDGPESRAKQLVKAWRQLRIELLRGVILTDEGRFQFEPQRELEFLAVLEATKAGEPHLHILLRSDYIPHDLISWRMEQLMGAKIVHITYLETKRKVANYVAKYMGKDPHRFGKLKRYWTSGNWQPKKENNRDAIGQLAPLYAMVKRDLDEWTEAHRKAGDLIFYEGKWVVALGEPPPMPVFDWKKWQ